MLVDTHCHLNIMIKKQFDTYLQPDEIKKAYDEIQEARTHKVTCIINAGTSLIESKNCITLAEQYDNVFATVGIHPNDGTAQWPDDLEEIKKSMRNASKNTIVGIGECGIDRHYPGYNIQQQNDLFKAQIELALEHDLALIVHSRNAYDETLRILEEFKNDISRGIIHCFSYDQAFADLVLSWGFVLGIGGAITYPKNTVLRDIVSAVDLSSIVLETDAPYLPPQIIRGKKNHPKHIATIAHYIADLRGESFETVAKQTTATACTTFALQGI